MKNNILFILLLIAASITKAQSSSGDVEKSYVGNINEMFPAAPTSNNLMKFEEVPVSYYTGIPDISLPLVNISTTNKNVTVSVQLKYHPLNAKPDDKSGETGLGWSLIAGGTISRTVRGGGPDEKSRLIGFSNPPKVKYGIYNKASNPTYKIINNDYSFNYNDYTFDTGIGKFDTEYDLYQYNFMGQSGRFYVVKNADGTYTVEKLDKNNLKISCAEDSTTGAIKSFTIIDDKGIQYLFDAMEKSQKSIANIKIGMTTGTGNIIPDTEIADYFTSFHLVKINDQNNTNLVEFKYDLSSWVKFYDVPTTTTRLAGNVNYTNYTGATGQLQSPDGSIPGAIEVQNIYNISLTRLLTSIEVKGKGTVYLNYEQGRQDSNYNESVNLYKLKSVQTNYIGQTPSSYTDKYIMDYDYSNVNYENTNGTTQLLKKLLLKKITKIAPNSQNSEYLLDYNINASVLKKDDWGYYTSTSGLSLDNAITTDVIKSITYPTKGKSVFTFDENEYSYHPTESVAMTPVTGYTMNNDYEAYINFSQFHPTDKQEFFNIQSAQSVNLQMLLGNLIYFNWKLRIFKKNADNTFSPAVYEFQYSAQTCNKVQPPACMVNNPNPDGSIISEFNTSVYLQPGIYYASLSGDYGPSNPAPTNDTFVARTTETTYVDVKISKGGGLRIKDLVYLENPSSTIFSKKYTYDYSNLDDPLRTSGALVFPKPIFKLSESYAYRNKLNNATMMYSADFDITTDYNILPVQKTQGADVGYKYVTVKQIDNDNHEKGRTEYTFRSPIDYPNEALILIQLPPLPIPNQDYLRGQLVSEKKYDSDNQLLSETTTDYVSSEYEKVDGVKLKDLYSNNMVAELFSFGSCQSLISQVGGSCALTTPYKNFEKFGVTLPAQKIEKSYFYKNGIQSSVIITTNNLYNTRDYPMSITQLFPDGNSSVTNYKYAHEKSNTRLINANMIGIPLETEVKKNSQTLSKVETLYNNVSDLFPSSVLSFDLQNSTPSTEITYDLYDSKGNLQQYTTKDGIPVSIVWGYNSTQPIAKIVGVEYSQINSLLTAIITASDVDASIPANEPDLLTALDTFRKNSALSNYQITTYTYDPLIGVTSITPPSGIREVYLYDPANRLKEIRENDASGKLLKEFKYNYKN
ncbi:hypothetical protein N0B16_05590 [Chryseobacterium sp. GMJ5]|uniref:YD repeat-containing protein n=1 Tax=Chryseobacterium gilvum TaxID=2976534 RepID=A0ABT2VWA8_9FLAO|nr:hypothetical protein [Chryseobacterium gilvum]MCU7613904.1 hypothetical protein [Chryseobacterium gilvum]